MSADGETRAILAAARRYVIHKSEEGVTVGLCFDGDNYGEASSAEGDLDAAVHYAFERVRQLVDTRAARAVPEQSGTD